MQRFPGKLISKPISKGFKIPNFRSPALGYFGHMWELYTFWAFLPALILSYKNQHHQTDINVSQWSFVIIASGSVACVIGGYLSEYFGTKTVAISALSLSCLCCLISPILLTYANAPILFCFLLFWGMVVIADSPLFSTLVAQNAPVASKGTLLTITNSIGFSLTIISIQFLGLISNAINANYLYTFLAIGPLLGIVMLLKKNLKNLNL